MSAAESRRQPFDVGRSRVPAVTRAAAILEIFAAAEGAPIGPSELARELSIAKSSAAYICDALVESGLARRAGAGYQLGHRLVGLGSAYLRTVDIVTSFYAVCRDLIPNIVETAQLAVLDRGLDVAYIAGREGSGPIRASSDVGRWLVATTTGTGKVMLSTLPWEEVAARVAAHGTLPRLTPNSITDEHALAVELEKIRQAGYAVDDEETLEGVFCVSRVVPTDDPRSGRHAVSLTMLKTQATPERIERCLSDLEAVSTELARRVGVSGTGDQARRA